MTGSATISPPAQVDAASPSQARTPSPTPQSREAFGARLRAIGDARYHDKHPFHQRLHGGRCTPDEVRAWVLNRYCYQAAIPRKDAALLSRCEDPALRRAWRKRIEDHDGGPDREGGIERWLRLAEAVGLDRDYVASMQGALPTSRFATEAYVNFVREKPLLEAIASSLTELFAPKIHRDRIAGLLQHYDFADDNSLAYFKRRLVEAPEDVAFGLEYVLDRADTQEKQEAVAAALTFKTDVLWAQLDALYAAYVVPGHIPPGAWRPGEGMRAPAPAINVQAGETPMPETPMPETPGTAATITDATVPRLPRGVRLHHDQSRDEWVLLAPERALKLDQVAVAVLQEIDGVRGFGDLVSTLAAKYNAPPEQIATDVRAFLTDLAEKRMVELA